MMIEKQPNRINRLDGLSVSSANVLIWLKNVIINDCSTTLNFWSKQTIRPNTRSGSLGREKLLDGRTGVLCTWQIR